MGFRLTLFINGNHPNSSRMVDTLTAILDRCLKNRFSLDIIDVMNHPDLAEKNHIIATPALVKTHPEPISHLIGDICEPAQIQRWLGIDQPDEVIAPESDQGDSRFSHLVEMSTDGIMILDKDGSVQFANPAALKLFGKSRQEMLGKHFGHPFVVGENAEIEALCPGKKPVTVDLRSRKIFWDTQEDYLVLLRNITERKLAEDQTKTALKEKEVLLQEIHHRVKNNMNVVSSLLKLHENSARSEDVKEALRESQGRIYAMSAVHEALYNSENLAEIDLENYLTNLCGMIIQTYSVNSGRIRMNIESDEVSLLIEKAAPLGITINELISNSLKYAFPDSRDGEITLRGFKRDNQLELIIRDNGVGMPEGFDWRKSTSLGLKLVQSLVENQLGGSLEMQNTNGTQFKIQIHTGE